MQIRLNQGGAKCRRAYETTRLSGGSQSRLGMMGESSQRRPLRWRSDTLGCFWVRCLLGEAFEPLATPEEPFD